MRAAALGAAALLMAAAQPPARSSLVDPADRLDSLRSELATLAMVQRNNELSPCVASDPLAFFESRASAGSMWGAQFEVLAPGQGNWFLVVKGSAEAAPWRQRITRAGEKWTTPAVTGETVDISLEGSGQPSARCPRVIMRGELVGGRPARPRGAVGPDDRWDATSPQFLALSDATLIAKWAPSVVHLQVFDTQRGLPCTGFFITPHIVMTQCRAVMTICGVMKKPVQGSPRCVSNT
jgi:hypothetical protein